MATQDIVNNNQSISYTNLDFASIYTEVLDTVKNLTYRWDPSISDESDPGVVLVKLSALIADKCNYNIDKSILEAFPLSVTQESNARQLYEQLGYYMNWYESATVPVTLSYDAVNNPVFGDITSYTIPKFTIITDAEAAHNYAIVGVDGPNGLVVSDTQLLVNGREARVVAMEGTPVQYQFLGETVITPQMVDDNNRLYFTSRYISQNGIFIKNTSQDNFASWKRVDNLYEQTYNELRYKFGYDTAANACYLEFPENYSELFGSGIEITYLVINPDFADIPAQTLNQFLVSINPKEDPNATLNAPTVKITNYAAAAGHKDVESINDAYVGYKKVVGTFKTLVTLRDYLNYIRRKDINVCSNAFVCDRTTDVQSSYKIVGKDHGIDTITVEVERSDVEQNVKPTIDKAVVSGKTYYAFNNDTLAAVSNPSGDPSALHYYELEGEELLSPFSLKFYLLQNAIALNGRAAYEETFEIDDKSINLDTLLEGTSHLEHTFEDILYFNHGSYKLSDDTSFEDDKSYFEKTQQDTDNPDAPYYYRLLTEREISELAATGATPVSKGLYETDVEALLPHTVFFRNKYPLTMNISTYASLDEDVQSDIMTNVISSLYKNLNSSSIEFGDPVSVDYLTEVVKKADARIKSVAFDNITYTTEAVYKDKYLEFDEDHDLLAFDGFTSVRLADNSSDMRPGSYTLREELDRILIEKDIVCKSILAGTTQLLVPDTRFNFHLCQRHKEFVENVRSITTEAEIDTGTMSQTSYSTSSENVYLRKTYTLNENETLTLFRPSLANSKEFNSGLHYEYTLHSDIKENQSHELRAGEYLILYSAQTSDETGDLLGYDVYAFREGAIIKPSFAMKAQPALSNMSEFAVSRLLGEFAITTDNWIQTTVTSGTWVTNIRNNNTIIANAISGTSNIKTQYLNTITLDQTDGYKFYWVLNNPTYTDNKTRSYVLFDQYSADQSTRNNEINSYTLKSGEYLYYVDSTYSKLAVLGAGTTIFRNCGLDATYQDKSATFGIKFVDYTTLTSSDDEFEWIKTSTGVINPAANGFYVQSSGSYIRTGDTTPQTGTTYYILLMNDVAGYFKKNTDGTYTAESAATSVFSQVDITNTDADINPSTLGYYEPIVVNGLPIEDKYKPFLPGTSTRSSAKYTFNRFTNSSDTSVLTRNIFKDSNYSDIVVGDSSTYKSITINNDNRSLFNPSLQGWMIQKDGKLVKELSVTPFTEISATGGVTKANFYKLADAIETYLNFESAVETPLQKIGGNAFQQYRNQYVNRTQAESGLVTYLDNQWVSKGFTSNLVRQLPSTWVIKDIEDTGRTAGSSTTFQAGDLFDITYLQLTSRDQFLNVAAIYPNINEAGHLYIDATTAKSALGTDIPSDAHIFTVGDTTTALDDADIITTICGTFYTQTYYDKLQIFATPIVYELKDLYAFNGKKYYTLNTYAEKNFEGTIQPWSCEAISNDQIAKDPIGTITNWRTIQDNTSITVTENELWALSAGDILTVTANTNDASSVRWPVFTNHETILDLDSYSVAYKRSGETEYTDLERLTVEDIKWKGYSSLLLNTASTNGQKLQSNHTVTLYDESGAQVCEQAGDSSKNIQIQLRYPVSNQSGNFINISTLDTYGDEILNSVYIFESLPSTDRYSYSTEKYITYVYFNKNSGETTASLPVDLPNGKYLIPVIGVEDLTFKVKYREVNGEATIKEEYLESYVNGLTTFSGDRYHYILLEKVGDEYIPIEDPEELTEERSPKELDWYEKQNDVYVLSTNEDTPAEGEFYVKRNETKTYLDFELQGYSKEVVLEIEDVFKFENNELFGEQFDEIRRQVNRLDINEKYNYCFIPKAKDLIPDPLQPKMFWNANHVMNRFTIAELDFDNLEYRFIT